MERMPDIQVDRNAGSPLFRQIAASIRTAIRADQLPAGTKLPATRSLAKQLGIHRRTVVAAFSLLQSEGWLESGVGQGTFVLARRSDPGTATSTNPSPAASETFPWETRIRRRSGNGPEPWRYFPRGGAEADPIRFMGATADPSLFPTEDFRGVSRRRLPRSRVGRARVRPDRKGSPRCGSGSPRRCERAAWRSTPTR